MNKTDQLINSLQQWTKGLEMDVLFSKVVMNLITLWYSTNENGDQKKIEVRKTEEKGED